MSNTELWMEYKNSPNTDLKKQIMLTYSNLVHYVIHDSKFATFNILDERDYYQFGVEGLSEAVDRFNPEYGTKFETYAIQRIRGKIIDELRKLQIKPRYASEASGGVPVRVTQLSLNSVPNDEDGYMLCEVVPNDSELPDTTTEKNEEKELLIAAIKNLGDRERLLITLYYYEHLSYKEIAEVLKITIPRVSQMHSKIISKLKSELKSIA